MSNSYIGLEKQFENLAERFGYIIIAYSQNPSFHVSSYMIEINQLIDTIQSKIANTSNIDRKNDLMELEINARILRNVATTNLSMDTSHHQELTIPGIRKRKDSKANMPIPAADPQFAPIQSGGRPKLHKKY
jgi:hypothetical protein